MNPSLAEKVVRARKVISDQCVNGRWQMCVPPQKDDSDMVLVDTLDALVAEVNRLENEIIRSAPEYKKIHAEILTIRGLEVPGD